MAQKKTEQRTSRHMTIACARCGKAAAEISLLPETVINRALWHNGDRLERTEFLGEAIRFGRWEQLADLFEAIRSGDYQTAAQLDQDFVGFICMKCGVAYCQDCWRVLPVFDEDDPNYYDHTRGVCPLGHEQMIDD